jgi:hypothetical protein
LHNFLSVDGYAGSQKRASCNAAGPRSKSAEADTACLGSFNRNKRPILGKVNSKIELT